MIPRLSNSIARGAVVVFAVVIGASLSFLAIRVGVASYASVGDSEKRLRLAVRLEPTNPSYWYLLGRYQQYNLEQPDSASAETSYKKAIELNPRYTDAWLELATAYEQDGYFDEARNAYMHAKKGYPVSPEVSWRYGNFLLRQGDRILAYAEMRRAIEADPTLAAIAFSRAYRTNPNLEEILQQLLPVDVRVYADVMKEALSTKQLAVALAIWNRLTGLRAGLDVNDVNRLVLALLEARDYATARRVWDQGVANMNFPALFNSPGSVIWDPSFESGITDSSFAWRYKSIQGALVSFDRSEKLTGAQSLRLSFDGKHNPDMDAACILGIVQPNTTYHFAGWIKTSNITTENGIEFRVFSPDDRQIPPFKTDEYHGTLPWTLVEGVWGTGPSTHEVEVCVTREPSDNREVRISGAAWIDQITLIPQPPKQRKR